MRSTLTTTDPWQMHIPDLPPDGPDTGAYSVNVGDRQGYDDIGLSAATDDRTGAVLDQGAAFATTSQYQQGTTETNPRQLGQQSLIGLTDEPLLYLPNAAEEMNNPGLTLARAGAPTDDGRIGRTIMRGNLGVDTWGQVDSGKGLKNESASPLASSPFYAGQNVPDGLPSPGGSGPALAAVDPVQVNTYRIAPSPWDELNYIGGPF